MGTGVIADTVTFNNQAVNGASVAAYLASRFGSVPGYNAAPPSGSPDGTAVTSTTFGGPGAFQITGLTAQAEYYVGATYQGVTSWRLYTAQGSGDATWTAITGGIGFQNGWGDASVGVGQAPSAYRISADGRVQLRGWITGGGRGTTAFTLPMGYRSGTILGRNLVQFDLAGNTKLAYALINTDGTVVITQDVAGDQWIDLGGISFWAGQ